MVIAKPIITAFSRGRDKSVAAEGAGKQEATRTDRLAEVKGQPDQPLTRQGSLELPTLREPMAARDNPASQMREQFTFEEDLALNKGKVEYATQGAKAWQVTSNTGTAGSLGYRRTKGFLVSLGLLNIILIGQGRNGATTKHLDGLQQKYKENLLNGLVDSGPFEQFPTHLNDKVDEENALFSGLLAAEDKNNQCHAALFERIHNKFSGMEDRYDALKNETLATLEFQDELMQNINENVAQTEQVTVSELTKMNADIEETLSAIESYKTYALAEYEALYENAQLNMDNAASTLDDIQHDVDSARGRIESTRARLEKNDKGLRGKIVGPLLDKLDEIDAMLDRTGQASHSFVDLGKTPEEFKAELDAQFAETETLLRNTQRSVDTIIANAENGRVTHDTLAQSLSESTQALHNYIQEDQTIQDALDETENLAHLLALINNSTNEYLERKNHSASVTHIANQTQTHLDDIYGHTVAEVSDAFNGTMSEKANRMFNRYDKATDGLYIASKVMEYLTYAYIGAVTGRRLVNEMRNRPKANALQWLNIRLVRGDEGGIYAGESQAGRDTGIKVKDLRRRRNCDVVLRSITSSKFFLGMAAVFLVKSVVNRAMAPALNDIQRGANALITDVDGTLSQAKAGYTDRLKGSCIETYDRKYRIDELNDHVSQTIQTAYASDPAIKNAIDYLQAEEGLTCQFNTLDTVIKDDKRKVIEARCGAIAQEYVEAYFNDDLKKEQYVAKLHDLAETLTGQETKYESRQKSAERNMIGLVLAHFITYAIIHLNKYKNPDVLETHDLAAKDRWVSKREMKRIPKVLAQINHTLHFLGLKLKAGNLLVVESGFMKGYNPKRHAEEVGSHSDDDSWVSTSSAPDSFSDIDLETGEVITPQVLDQLTIPETAEGKDVEVYFSLDADDTLNLSPRNYTNPVQDLWGRLVGSRGDASNQSWHSSSPRSFSDTEQGRVAQILTDIRTFLFSKGFALKAGNIVVTDHDKIKNLAADACLTFDDEEPVINEVGDHSGTREALGFEQIYAPASLDSSPRSRQTQAIRGGANTIKLNQFKTFDAEYGEEGIEIKFSVNSNRTNHVNNLLKGVMRGFGRG